MSTFTATLRKLARFFIIFGLVFGGAPGIIIYPEIAVRREWELIEAEVVKVQEHVSRNDDGVSYTYTPTFRFEYHGTTVEKSTHSSSSSYNYAIWSIRQIYYSPKTGHISANDSSDYFMLIFPGVGLMFLIGGIFGLVQDRRWKQKIKKLREVWIRKEGKFAGIQDTKMRINNTPQVRVMVSSSKSVSVSEGTPPNVRYSDIISAKKAYTYTADSVFTVYVDPFNPEEYFVDLDSVH